MSIVDYMNANKMDSSFANRSTLAQQYGINNFTGSANQNVQLLNMLKSQPTQTVTQPKPSIVQPKAVTQNVAPNPQQYIDQLNQARKREALAGLDNSRKQSLSNLNKEKAEIQPRYYDARNQAAASNQQQARNFAEFMASRGGARSGASAQAEISNQGVLQGNLGLLGRQENAAFDNIANRTTDVNNTYQSELARVQASIEAERNQALLEQMVRDRQLEWEKQQFNTLSAYQKAQIEQQNKARASRGGGGGQNYSKMYEDLLMQIYGKEKEAEINRINNMSTGITSQKGVSSIREQNYRPQF